MRSKSVEIAEANYNSAKPRGVYRKWTNESMITAMDLVSQGESFRSVSEEFQIPLSTLHDHVSGKI